MLAYGYVFHIEATIEWSKLRFQSLGSSLNMQHTYLVWMQMLGSWQRKLKSMSPTKQIHTFNLSFNENFHCKNAIEIKKDLTSDSRIIIRNWYGNIGTTPYLYNSEGCYQFIIINSPFFFYPLITKNEKKIWSW